MANSKRTVRHFRMRAKHMGEAASKSHSSGYYEFTDGRVVRNKKNNLVTRLRGLFWNLASLANYVSEVFRGSGVNCMKLTHTEQDTYGKKYQLDQKEYINAKNANGGRGKVKAAAATS